MTDNTLLVSIVAGVLILLALLQLYLATRHDRVITAQGPIEDLAVYESRLNAKMQDLADIDDKISQREAALADVAHVGAEVEALRKQKENFLAEWATMEDKRREVQSLREEIEQIFVERQALESEIAPLRAEYNEVKERLEKAETLVGRIDALAAEHESLETKVSELRAQTQALQEAEQRVEMLEKRAKELQSDSSTLEERISSREHALSEISTRLSTEQELLADAQAQQVQVQAELATARLDLRSTRNELEITKEEKSNLQSFVGRLEGLKEQRETEVTELSDRLDEKRGELSDVVAEYQEATLELTSERMEVRSLGAQIESLGESRAALEARLAVLDEEIKRKQGTISGEPVVGDDKLRELKETPPVIRAMQTWDDAPLQNEADALKTVDKRLRAKGLDYPARTVRAFHTAMKTNETTQMAVLAGISGTGKSQLPRQYAAGMGIGFLQVPVQPRWDSPQDLMGFYNYIESKFRPTDMARALWAMDEIHNPEAVKDRMMMILLDEMNLARVEYYFSDFLSRLESRPRLQAIDDENERKDAEIELEIPNMENPPRIFPGYNLLFAGTMNEDESTQSLSDKVVDRANILRFAAPKKIKDGHVEGDVARPLALSRKTWAGWVRSTAEAEKDMKVVQSVETMVDLMKDFKRPFGHRLGRAIMAYVANYPQVEGARLPQEALADQVEMRLLPKLRGVEVDAASETFSRLKDFAGNELADEILADAIESSLQLASETTGQFVWTGVTR
ncbi:chromosome segregation ATPase-like protein [Mameliella alba]|nr:chromosome segregation ATPase-like protein [Antarctobacter heliothermus]MBY6143839.1 chromosome segregation ATPase-like protein [Mameliella alba]MCA0953889.1 chromosome segregation ATPase-like protein [Mameliella alba]